jgi:long-chain acyl-CoA synthetase
MDKIWLTHYQEGVPHTIDPDRYRSLADLFVQQCKQFKHHKAFSSFGYSISFQQCFKLSRNLAAYLQQLGLNKGDRIALMLPNCLQYPVSLFAALQLGLVVVNLDPLYTAPELIARLNHTNAQVLIVLSNLSETIVQAQKETRLKKIIVTELGDLLSWTRKWAVNLAVRWKRSLWIPKISDSIKLTRLLAIGKKLTLHPVAIHREDIAFLQHTGGTTGTLKAAVLTHHNVLSNIEQLAAWVKPILSPGKEVMLTALPLYHIFALMANGLMGIRIGAQAVLIADPRNVNQLVRTLKKEKLTVLIGVNSLFSALLNHPNFKKLDFSSWKLSLGGGASIDAKIKKQWKLITGKSLFEGYGLTEASPVICVPPWQETIPENTVGLPLPSTDISIRDDRGSELACGEVGELCIKGPQVMQGYWKNPDETRMVLQEGWLLTGDMARIDEQGFVYIVDRKKDLILVSGFNVYPSEVEAVLNNHPKVKESAVVGIASEKSGESVKALVVKRDASLTEEELIAYCRNYLTGYKRPKQIEFLTRLPKSKLGKVLKRKLR